MLLRLFLILSCLPLINCTGHDEDTVRTVLPGAFQLDAYLPLLAGKNIGIVANNGSVIHDKHLIDSLLDPHLCSEFSYSIKKIFSPEHGFSGYYDAGSIIESEEQFMDSIEIVSLYGKDRKPKLQDIKELDLLVFDLQDVGVRFYTYISTLHYVMLACAENNLPLIVLDRPNPHAHYVDGPIMEEKYKSFVGMHSVPIIYGMTIGEYAQMINGERWLGDSLQCDLTVIENTNYFRDSYYRIPIKPSPNLPDMKSILLYPSLCLFEGTVMSVGRGTEHPFQMVGHPGFPDKSFSFKPVSTPGASLYPKYLDERCYGYDFSTFSIDTLRTFSEIKLEFILDAYNKMNMGDGFFIDYFELLVGTDNLRKQINQGLSEEQIRASWQPDIQNFMKIREKYLIYKESSNQ